MHDILNHSTYRHYVITKFFKIFLNPVLSFERHKSPSYVKVSDLTLVDRQSRLTSVKVRNLITLYHKIIVLLYKNGADPPSDVVT